MSARAPRIFFFLVLALICYGIGVFFGEGTLAFALFFGVGIFAELVFWRHLYLRLVRRR